MAAADPGGGDQSAAAGPGLAIHPPILYTGYVGFSIPFAFAVAALLEGRVDAAWGRWVRPWTLAAWCFLTCGIALGSWWAYYELGWGGFWFWDPVENACLLPWLTGTALLHSCDRGGKAGEPEDLDRPARHRHLLAAACAAPSWCARASSIPCTALPVDPTQGVFILTLLAITIGGSLILFAFRAPVLAASGVFAPISREGALVLNNVLLCSLCAVVFTGTAYPLFAALFHVQLSVGPPYFHLTVVPLLVPLFAAMSVGPVLAWKRADLAPALLRLWWAGAIAALIGIGTEFGLHRAFAAAGFAGAAWLILGGVRRAGRADPAVPHPARHFLGAVARPAARRVGRRDRACRDGGDGRRDRGDVAGAQHHRRGGAGADDRLRRLPMDPARHA